MKTETGFSDVGITIGLKKQDVYRGRKIGGKI